jgi:uncharacterized tellurite resistance protein B-like protein
VFLELMTEEQQQLFLDTAVRMAHVDGHLHLDESAFIERVQRETGGVVTEASELSRADLIAKVTKQFSDAGLAGRAFLLELAGLVVADGKRDDAELEFLREIAEVSGVPSADVPLFLDFAERALDLAEDARDLLAASNEEI